MNSVALGGRVYGVESIVTKSGASMVKFRLQVQRYKKEAFYVDIVSFDKNADFVQQYVKDGSGVFVSGKLDEDFWEKEDVKHRKLKLIADRVEFLPNTQKKETVKDESETKVTTQEEVSF